MKQLDLGSAPELTGGERGALCQRFELGPGDLWMDAAAETAIGRRNDPLFADKVRKPDDALRDEFGVLDDIGGVADDARQDQFTIGQLDLLPHLPLVFVADI